MDTSVSMKKSEEPIVVEQVFDASVQKVWAAITEQDQMVQWFFNNIPAFEPRLGFETEFNVEVEDRTFPHLWKVTAVVPEQSITYQWRFGGYEGRAFSTFHLIEDGDQTQLRLAFDVVEDYTDGIPEFTRKSGEEGWKYFIQNSLKEYLSR